MKFKIPAIFKFTTRNKSRRRLLQHLLTWSGVAALSVVSNRGAHANSPQEENSDAVDDLRFPGDLPSHKLVYQLNKADAAYQNAILTSIGAMIKKYGDDVHVVVVAIGPGIHILAKKPKRPVSTEIKQRVKSFSVYNVKFNACGNTLKALGWDEKDVLPFADVVEVGAASLMELQEQGYAYISW